MRLRYSTTNRNLSMRDRKFRLCTLLKRFDRNGRNHCFQPCAILYFFSPSERGAVQWPVKHAALLVDPSTVLSQFIAKIDCAAKGGVYKEPLRCHHFRLPPR
jgi:hypothetical protein